MSVKCSRGTTRTCVGRLRIDVGEGDAVLVLVHLRGGISPATILQNMQSSTVSAMLSRLVRTRRATRRAGGA